MSSDIASIIKFGELCKVFETTCAAKKQEKTEALNNFIKQYREKAEELKFLNPNTNTSFYPALRLILPQLERERGPYGLKEFTLAKRIVKLLGLPPNGTDATRLSNFRSSSNSTVKDFADAAYWVLRKYYLDGSKLSLAEVNVYLDKIAERHVDNDPRGVDDQLSKLFQGTSAEEQRWLIRIILKDLRLGVGQDRVLRLYHPDAVDLYSSNNSLLKVCGTLKDPSERLHEIEVSIFSPFRPMLSQRCDIAQFQKVFGNDAKFFLENKFDGERFQLHMENGQFKYFSRNGYDYTSTYGDSFNSGLYTPLLKKAFKSHVKKLILDGEMMGWNTKTKQFGSKGMNFDVKHLKADSRHQPCFCVFDILLLNDQVVTSKPLRDRLLLLDTILTPVQGVIVVSHRIEATIKQDILDALNTAMDNEEEGVVFKDALSIYKSNDRNAGWWKVKLEYFENVMSDLDVIVMGGYYGDGRHARRISGFLVGVAIPPTDNKSQTPSGYLSLSKIASGLSNDELGVIEKNLGPHWRKMGDGDPEKYGLQWGKEKPDVWIPPDKSCVLLVRASELIRIHSLDFKTDYTLRFPRIQKIRLDKPYYDCLTVGELQDLTSSGSKSVKKLNKRHLELSDLEVAEKERKVRRRYVNAEIQPVEQKSELLKGYEFFVLTGGDEWKKDDVEIAVRESGGTVVRNEGTNTLCILVGHDHPRVNCCKQFDTPCDLVKLQWLRNILDTGIFRIYTPKDMLHASKKTRERFSTEYDKYGDSYTEDATLESVQNIIEEVQKSKDYMFLTAVEVENLENELNVSHPVNVLKNWVAYFDVPGKNYEVDSSNSYVAVIEEMEFKFLGGRISNILDEDVTHIVTDNSDELRRKNIIAYLRRINNTQATIVSKSFISEKLIEVKIKIF